VEEILEGIAHIVDQMKPVGHLLGLRKSSMAGQTVGPGAVSGKHLHLRMAPQTLAEILGTDALE
jgi:hypothetical protein